MTQILVRDVECSALRRFRFTPADDASESTEVSLWVDDQGPVRGKPTISVSAWLQYLLDNYGTVAEALEALQSDPFTVIIANAPNGAPALVHISLSDAKGDSAILQYVDGELKIHHSREYTVITNSPTYDQQLAINAYWELIGGERMLPLKRLAVCSVLALCLVRAASSDGPIVSNGLAPEVTDLNAEDESRRWKLRAVQKRVGERLQVVQHFQGFGFK